MARMTDDDENVVRLEVDASSLKPAFDNIADGFNDQGKAIRSLRLWQGVLGLGVLAANIGVITLAVLR